MAVGLYVRNKSLKLPNGSDGSARLSSQTCEIDGADMSLSGFFTSPEKAPVIPRLLDGQPHRVASLDFNTSEAGHSLLGGDPSPGLHEVNVRGYVRMTVHLVDGRGNIIGAPLSVSLRTGAAKSSIEVDKPEEPGDAERY